MDGYNYLFIYPLLDKRTHFIWLLHLVILGALNITIFIGPLITRTIQRPAQIELPFTTTHRHVLISRVLISRMMTVRLFYYYRGLAHSALTGHCALHEPDAIMNSNKFYTNGTFFHFYNKYCPVFNNSLSDVHLRNVYVTKNVSLDLL